MFTAKSQLAEIGLRTPSEIVAAVVRRLINGESLYSIYYGEGALVSKRTAEKICCDEEEKAISLTALF